MDIHMTRYKGRIHPLTIVSTLATPAVKSPFMSNMLHTEAVVMSGPRCIPDQQDYKY